MFLRDCFFRATLSLGSTAKHSRRPQQTIATAIICATTLLAGCQSTPDLILVDHKEITGSYDNVFGNNFLPTFKLSEPIQPTHFLVLPATGQAEDTYRDSFHRFFATSLREGSPYLVTSWHDAVTSLGRAVPINRTTAHESAKALGCDYIISLSLPHHSPFQPLSLATDIRIESVATGAVVGYGANTYDSQSVTVCNSARRFYLSTMPANHSPDRSLHILQNADLFTRFVATDLGTHLKHTIHHPPKKKSPAPDNSGSFLK